MSGVLVNGKNYCERSFGNAHENFSSIFYVRDNALFNALYEYANTQLRAYFRSLYIELDSFIDTPLSINLHFGDNEHFISAYFEYDSEYWSKPWSLRDYFGLMLSKINKIPNYDTSCAINDTYGGLNIYELQGGIGVKTRISDPKESLGSLCSRMKITLIQLHLEVEEELKLSVNENIIEKSIQFEPEYYQAGLGILNFFGTYLREQYPDEQASVKIEQKDLTVRMIIETEDGQKDIVEKALHEYELIITGAESFNKFSNNEKLNLELRSELRIAKARLETQQDLIGFQQSQLCEKSQQIEKLLNTIGKGLSQPNNLTIEIKNDITQTNKVDINQNISAAICNLTELISELPKTDESRTRLNQLEESLTEIESDNNPESVRRSPAMSKFRRLFDNIMDTDSDLHKAISKAESGWEIAKDLAGKYNKIAEWCGLPTVPNAFIK